MSLQGMREGKCTAVKGKKNMTSQLYSSKVMVKSDLQRPQQCHVLDSYTWNTHISFYLLVIESGCHLHQLLMGSEIVRDKPNIGVLSSTPVLRLLLPSFRRAFKLISLGSDMEWCTTELSSPKTLCSFWNSKF